jgi:phosphomannomutase
MSSSRALRDVTNANNGTYEASAVGEVNVVELMKKNNAIIGGEGNGLSTLNRIMAVIV